MIRSIIRGIKRAIIKSIIKGEIEPIPPELTYIIDNDDDFLFDNGGYDLIEVN